MVKDGMRDMVEEYSEGLADSSNSEENKLDVLLPLHPRTAKLLEFNLDQELHQKIKASAHFKIIAPVSFLEMIDSRLTILIVRLPIIAGSILLI